MTVVVTVAALVGPGLVAGCSHDSSIAPPTPAPQTSDARATEAQAALDGLERAVADGSLADARAVAAQASTGLLEGVYDSARALRLTDVSLRYVAPVEAGPTTAERERYGAAAFVATVQVRYRIPVYDDRATSMQTAFVFVPAGNRVMIASAGGHGARVPTWLTGRLHVVRTAHTLVTASSAAQVARFSRYAVHAVSDVGKVLHGWHGPLVIEVPPDEQGLDEELDVSQSEYADIAAVTTTVTGSTHRGAPVHVFVNPRVFGGLKPLGAQVVLSHEATHVATGASFTPMPEWLLEGFADYVALDHAGVPVDTAASQILARIRAHGLPKGLPTAADLEPTANGLGATYEEAWLANRFLSQRYGEPALVAFYRTVSTGVPVATAFRTVVGTSQAAFVRAWRADLRTLAGPS